jgi:iron complex outermembrane receptor protein
MFHVFCPTGLTRRAGARAVRFIIHHSSFIILSPSLLFSQKTDTLADDQRLREIVVQATRTDARSPVPHSNFSAEKIKQQYHAQDVPYLLSAVPSLVESSDAGTGIGYTGLRIRGSDPTRINVTINGLPLNDAESQGVFWVDLPDLAASAAEIQVQRGVGTSTNGAGAFGATINLDLSKVASAPYAALSSTLGSFGTRKHSLQAGTGLLQGRLAFAARLSRIQSEGFIDRATADLNALHLNAAYLDERQSAQFHLLSGHEITYQAWNGVPAQYIENEKLRTFNTAGTEHPGAPYADEVDNYTQRHFLAHYKRVLTPRLHLQLNGHYTRGFGFYEQYKADEDFADYGLEAWNLGDTSIAHTDLVRRRWLDNHFYGSTFALRWLPGGAWRPTFLLGGALSRYEGQHFGEVIWTEFFTGAGKDFRYYDNHADKRDANVFLKIETSPTRRFSTFLDLQIRSVRYQFLGFDNELRNVEQTVALGFFNPKIGTTYSFSDKWLATAFFGVAHREPNRDDYTQSSPASRPRAERLLDLEMGLRRSGKNGTLSANFFWMRYRDQLALDGRINDVGAYIRTNVPDSRRTGLELEASALPHPRFALLANASLSQNKILEFVEFRDNWDTGAQEAIVHRNTDLAFSPRWVARGEATFFVLKKNTRTISTTLVGKYVGEQFLDNTSNPQTALAGYFVSDLRLNADLAQVLGNQMSIIFSLNNWLDKKYAANGWAYRYTSAGYDARPDDAYTRSEGGGVYHQAGFFPQAGRHWMATLRLEF